MTTELLLPAEPSTNRFVFSPAPRAFLFDVDGTLTAPRSTMPAQFEQWFAEFCARHTCSVVSGGMWERVSRQVGPRVAQALKNIHLCNGNEQRTAQQVCYRRPVFLSLKMRAALQVWLEQGPALAGVYPHLEERPGMLTLTWLDTNASAQQRCAFEHWDALHGLRARAARSLSAQFPHWTFQPAGQTSLDLFEQGADKSQVLLREGPGPFWFFADAVYPGGNDWSLAQALSARNDGSRVFKVRDWKHTWALLRNWEDQTQKQAHSLPELCA